MSLPNTTNSFNNSILKYVRQEFKAHRDVSEEQEQKFMSQWEDYASHLALEAVSNNLYKAHSLLIQLVQHLICVTLVGYVWCRSRPGR